MNTIEKFYGLVPMTLDQELNAPDPIKRTRANKIEIVDKANWIKDLAESMTHLAKSIPEKNDKVHADKVEKFKNFINSAYAAMVLANEERFK